MDHPGRRFHLPTIHFQVLCWFQEGYPMMGARPLRFVRLQHRKTIWNWITVSSQPLLYIPQKIYHIIHSTTSTIPQHHLVAAYWHLPKTLTKTWDAMQTISEGRLLVGTFAMVLSVFASSSRYFPGRGKCWKSQIQGSGHKRSLRKQTRLFPSDINVSMAKM